MCVENQHVCLYQEAVIAFLRGIAELRNQRVELRDYGLHAPGLITEFSQGRIISFANNHYHLNSEIEGKSKIYPVRE